MLPGIDFSSRPPRFRTHSDCEPVVHLYEKVGHAVASKLDGDFAFVILDEVTGEVS